MSSPEKKSLFKPKKMVGWFDMKQLSNTGIKATLSSIFGSYADKRETIASISEFKIYDYSNNGEIWFDYIADVGDGFDSTYTMAHLVSRDDLYITRKNKQDLSLPKGKLLVFGGDQVYPVATRENYVQRFKIPYELAWPASQGTPEEDIFAIPGNHDWYDGLTNFMKVFCQDRKIGNWRTTQNRSYFAIKLTSSTWIFGIDVQLDADIDMPQLSYFEKVSTEHMKPGDNVILCSAKPSWVFHNTHKHDRSYDTLKYFETRFIEEKKMNLLLSLSGDLHHYSHYESQTENKSRTHKITSGGGGAFMQATHNLPDKLKDLREGEYKLKKVFPDKVISRLLVFNNYKFFTKNWSFGLFMGFVYLIYAWFLQTGSRVAGTNILAHFERAGFSEISILRRELTSALLNSPALLLLTGMIVIGLWKFCEKSANDKRTGILGFIHGTLHVWLIIALFWGLAYFNYHYLSIPSGLKIPVLGLEIGLLGGVCASWLMGLYLGFSNLVFKIHDKEAFSAMKIEDFKNFLRIHVTDKKITIYPVGLTKIARWKRKGEIFVTDSKIDPHLIEDPVEIDLPAK